MALSDDLQTMVGDMSAAIATGQPLGRADLEVWRRRLTAAAAESRLADAKVKVLRSTANRLVRGIERRVLDLTGLARMSRESLGDAS